MATSMATLSEPQRPGAPEHIAEPDEPTTAKVVAAIMAFDTGLEPSLKAVQAQVYEVTRIVVIGGEEVTATAAELGVERHASLGGLVQDLEPDIEYVWVVHGDALPRPDALTALTKEAARNDAAVVGSKVLDAADPEHLESVGSATDVFGDAYSGLDEGEVDLEQYDVVRDVAFVLGVSMLVRRDLLRGLGGSDPLLPPVAAGLDLSQRARLAGARVMVAPSAEVMHVRSCGHDFGSWSETAGRMRAMGKVYRPVTLVWVVPFDLLIGLVDGLVHLVLGQPRRLGGFLTAVGWNLRHLPSTLSTRRAARALRAVGDEELFRYQVSGSVRLRELGAEVGGRWQRAVDDEGALGGVATRFSGRAPLAALIAVFVLGLGARGLWFGTPPSSGFTLPITDDPVSVMSAYAGGWNEAGLGSPHAVHPVAAFTAAARWLLFGWDATFRLVTAGAMVAGLFGFARLLRRYEITGPARYAAGLAAVAGPAWLWFAGRAYWPGILALGAIPFALDAVLRPWPATARGRAGRLGTLAVTFGVLAAVTPVGPLVPVAGVVILVAAGLAPPGPSLAKSVVGTVLGGVVLGSYLASASVQTLLDGGVSFDREPVWWMWAAVLAASAITIVGGGSGSRPAAAGALAAGAGLLGALLAPWEVAVASMALAGVGVALVVSAAFGSGPSGGGWRGARLAAGLVASIVVLTTLSSVPGGTAGIGGDEWGRRLQFAASLDESPGSSRILLVGEPADLPGAWRSGPGFAYRTVTGSTMTLDQAWLPPRRAGDSGLEAALEELMVASSLRPGRLLGPFALRWAVVVGDSPFADAVEAQLDLRPQPLAVGVQVYENLDVVPRAVTDTGVIWDVGGGIATGSPIDGRVRIADNLAPGWTPGVEADAWAISASASAGRAAHIPDPTGRALGIAGATVLVLGMLVAVWGRARP
jgi:hypothetical protein